MLEQISFAIDESPWLSASFQADSYSIGILPGRSSSLREQMMPAIAEPWVSDFQPIQNIELAWTTYELTLAPLIALPAPHYVPLDTYEDFLLGETFSTDFYDDLLSPQNSTLPDYWQGTLRADRFFIDLNDSLTIISGNGNVEYGDGLHDFLDLTNLSSQSVAGLSLAEEEGVVFDVGNGDRVFDSLLLNNGSQVLFEGLDSIQFADVSIDLSIDPNDPMFDQQWNLHMMGVQNAWRFTQGSSDILVGVQDTGLGYNNTTSRFHADIAKTTYLSDNAIDDFFRNVMDDAYGERFFSHGTSVQSIISATTNNGYGMSGINWNSGVFNIDVLDNNEGDLSLVQATQTMIDYAKQQGKKLVINMSLGGSGQIDPNLSRLVANNQDNALFVIASGNDGVGWLNNPASLSNDYGNVMGIGASWGTEDYFGRETQLGDRIDYTHENWWGSNYGYGISLMGPSEVVAATASPSLVGTQFGWTDKFNGTSAAAPNVAGVASLVWSIDSRFSANQVSQILKETAYDLGDRGYDYETGAGLVNADAAVRRAMALSRELDSFPFGFYS